MKTLNFYVTKQFCFTLLMSIGILTFGLMGTNMLKVFKLMANGVPIADAGLFLMYIMPTVLSIGIPWAILVAVMLVFGKMSADNEVTAMRACGISIMQIISPIILIVFGLSFLCLYLQLDLAPHCKGLAKQVGKNVAISNPTAMFQPGEELPIDDMRITIANRTEDDKLEDIQIYVMNSKGDKLVNDIRANRGELKVDKAKELIFLKLYEVTSVTYTDSDARPLRVFNTEWTHAIEYGKELNAKSLGKKLDYMSWRELFGRATLDNRLGLETTRIEIFLHERMALGLSPIAFLLLGLPLAIRTSRRETSHGLLLCVILAGVFFAFVTIFRTMHTKPELYPQLMLWIPNILYQIGGMFFIYKIAKR